MKQLVCSVMLTNDLSKAESTGGITHSGCHAFEFSRNRVVTNPGCDAFGLSRIRFRHESGNSHTFGL